MNEILINKALKYCIKVHRYQYDLEGLSHSFHAIGVARKVGKHHNAIAIALLHDVLEDTIISYRELRLEFGSKVAEGVLTLTREDNESWNDYINKIIKSDDKMLYRIKIADIEDNISRMPKEKKIGMYIEAHRKLCKKLNRESKLLAQNV